MVDTLSRLESDLLEQINAALLPLGLAARKIGSKFPIGKFSIPLQNGNWNLEVVCDYREQTVDVMQVAADNRDVKHQRNLPGNVRVRQYLPEITQFWKANSTSAPRLSGNPNPAERERFFRELFKWVISGLCGMMPRIVQRLETISKAPPLDGES